MEWMFYYRFDEHFDRFYQIYEYLVNLDHWAAGVIKPPSLYRCWFWGRLKATSFAIFPSKTFFVPTQFATSSKFTYSCCCNSQYIAANDVLILCPRYIVCSESTWLVVIRVLPRRLHNQISLWYSGEEHPHEVFLKKGVPFQNCSATKLWKIRCSYKSFSNSFFNNFHFFNNPVENVNFFLFKNIELGILNRNYIKNWY